MGVAYRCPTVSVLALREAAYSLLFVKMACKNISTARASKFLTSRKTRSKASAYSSDSK